MLAKELVAASTVPLVLSVLTGGENYGYTLVQHSHDLRWQDRVDRGMLYPVLHWMEQEDLIESEWRAAETGRSGSTTGCARKAGTRSFFMSRIGKKPIPIPKGVTVKIEGNTVLVQGPKGKLDTALPTGIKVEQKDGNIVAIRENDSQAALHGLARALVNNAVEGVTKGCDARSGDRRHRLSGRDEGQRDGGVQPRGIRASHRISAAYWR